MKTEEEKQTWVTPEIVDLDVKETEGKQSWYTTEVAINAGPLS